MMPRWRRHNSITFRGRSRIMVGIFIPSVVIGSTCALPINMNFGAGTRHSGGRASWHYSKDRHQQPATACNDVARVYPTLTAAILLVPQSNYRIEEGSTPGRKVAKPNWPRTANSQKATCGKLKPGPFNPLGYFREFPRRLFS